VSMHALPACVAVSATGDSKLRQLQLLLFFLFPSRHAHSPNEKIVPAPLNGVWTSIGEQAKLGSVMGMEGVVDRVKQTAPHRPMCSNHVPGDLPPFHIQSTPADNFIHIIQSLFTFTDTNKQRHRRLHRITPPL